MADASGMDSSMLLGAGLGGLMAVCFGVYYCWGGPKANKAGDAASSSRKVGVAPPTKDSANYPAGRLHIYFGSQTGTAEGFARVLMEEGRSKGFDAKMCDLDGFDAGELAGLRGGAGVAIFLMATYGEGEPTDNAASFAKWMDADKGSAEPGCLGDVPFTVFGLGNRQYEHFNAMGKATNAGLERLGGRRVYAYGEGDDDNALEDDFEAWKGPMWAALVQQFHPDVKRAAGEVSEDAATTPRTATLHFSLRTLDAKQAAAVQPVPAAQVAASTRHFFTCSTAAIVANRELRENDPEALGGSVPGGSTRHIEIDLNGTGLSYQTADNLAVLPENDPEVVRALCLQQGYPAEAFTVEALADDDKASFKHAFPVPCTAASALRLYFDIRGAPSISLLRALLPYVQDDAQKRWLAGLLDKDQRAQLKAYLEAHACCVASLLLPELGGGELSSARIPLCDLLHLLPALQPRYYTISSSSSVHPSTVHVTVSVTQFKTPAGRAFTGLASAHLSSPPPPSCRVFVRASSFRLPQELSAPITMIGPGTGLAPMRALLQERRFRASGRSASRNTLYFGCRHARVDFIYRAELEAFAQDGTLSALHTAFSRAQADKVYVQHLLAQPANRAALLADLDQGGHVYVCGATKMGADVLEAVLQVLAGREGGSRQAAQAELKELQRAGRYVQELWGSE